MKPEEKDELKENDLAGWLQFGMWNFVKQNGSYIFLGLALAFLGYQLWTLHERKLENERQTAWAEFHAAEQTPLKMVDVISSHDNKMVQAEAYLALGGYFEAMAIDRATLADQKLTHDEALDKAYTNYSHALEAMGSDPLIAAKSHLGMAAVWEDKGDWEKAKGEYELLTSKTGQFANTAFAPIAAERLATLDDRRHAPRLAAMIPAPRPVAPQSMLPGIGGPTGSPSLPGVFNAIPGPTGMLPPQPPPLTGSGMLAPAGPFLGPAMPEIAPAPVTVPPASAPAAAPAAAPK